MKTLVIIPTYNERENVESLIGQILSQPVPVDVAVADDRSPDGTGEIVERLGKADPRVHLITIPERRGYGRAVVGGFRFALEKGYECAVTMDADFSHDPKYLPDIMQAIRDGSQLVVGSRYTSGISVVNWPLRRLILSVCANRYVQIITGLPLSDCTSGYRAIRREVLEAIDIESVHSNGYSFISEVNFRAFRKGYRLKEVPIIFVERRLGGSKMSAKVIYEAMWMPWRLRFGF